MPKERALCVLDQWIDQGLKNIRFSGGEPTLYPYLVELVQHCKDRGVERIAISSNGSASRKLYADLLKAGVNDFSISLDACCASFAEKMARRLNVFGTITDNIRWLASQTYVTAGIVLTNENYGQMNDTIRLADSLGVSDIRIISAAQENFMLEAILSIDKDLLEKHPILKFRAENISNGIGVRGIQEEDCYTCYLAADDSVVAGDQHFPCIVYLREGGNPIGKIGPNMRQDRMDWLRTHNSYEDPICRKNCLDVCIAYNNKVVLLQDKLTPKEKEILDVAIENAKNNPNGTYLGSFAKYADEE
jgi:MoaA/NifB/PqqE/SkfB family radical SAM enzyme